MFAKYAYNKFSRMFVEYSDYFDQCDAPESMLKEGLSLKIFTKRQKYYELSARRLFFVFK